jgi:ERCC4-type nuclease
MIIKIDNRENELIALCRHYIEIIPNYKDIKIIVEALPLGDIIICDNEEEKVVIERKSLSDLASSIKDGRYEEQSYRLNGLPHHNHNIIYLIEGDINKMLFSHQTNLFKNKIEKTTLYSTIVSLNYFKGFSVLRTFNLDETSIMICNMAYKIEKSEKENKFGFYSNKQIVSNNSEEESNDTKETEKNYCNVVKKVKKENITSENIGEIMLCQIPGISSTTAIAIMQHFKTISNLIIQLNNQPDIMNNLTYVNEKGQKRKISKTVIENITKFLYNK